MSNVAFSLETEGALLMDRAQAGEPLGKAMTARHPWHSLNSDGHRDGH